MDFNAMYNKANCLGLIVPEGAKKGIRGRAMGEVLALKNFFNQKVRKNAIF